MISSITVPSGGTGGTPVYQWQISTDNINWTDISGATADTYDPPNITETTYYRRSSRRSTCTALVYSNVVTKAIVNNLTDAGTIGSNATACTSVAQIAITEITAPSGGNNGTIEYSWQSSTNGGSSWATIVGATSANYTPTAISLTTLYRRGARRSPCATILYSNVVTRAVITNITNAGTIAGNETSCDAFDPAEITSVTAATGGTGSIDSIYYQWQMSTNGSTWIDIQNANSANFNPGFITSTTYYRRAARTNPCTAFLFTPSVIKTVNNYSNAGTISGDQSVCGPFTVAPTVISPIVVPSGGGGTGTVQYQWQISTNQITWTDISGATAATYTPVLPVSTTTYYRRATKRSTCTSWIYSNIATKTVINNPTTGGTIGYDEVVCSGGIPSQITEIVAPTGGSNGTAIYSWQSSPNGSTWTNIAGATAISYTPPAISVTTHYRRGIRISPCATPIYSSAVIKTVITNITGAGTIAGAETGCSPFNPAIITSATAPSGGTGSIDSIAYQWQSSPNGTTWTDIAGATMATYDPPTITATTHYRRGAKRNPCGTFLYSNIIIKTVSGTNISNGGTIAAYEANCGPFDPALITQTIAASGAAGTIQYIWEQSTDNGASWVLIAGATNATYDPTTISVTTMYRRGAKISTCAAYTYSNIVTKEITTGLTIGGVIGWNEMGCSGYTPTTLIEISTAGGGTSYNPIEYIWEQHTSNGWTLISGATNLTYTPPALTQTTWYRRGARRSGCNTAFIYSNLIMKEVINNFTTGGTIGLNEQSCNSYDPNIINQIAAPSGGNGGFIDYIWEQSTNGGITWTTIVGAKNISYDPPIITQTTMYRRGVTRFSCDVYIYSNIVTKSIGLPTPILSSQTISNICPNNTVNLSIITVSNAPSGAILTFHSATPATAANKIANITAVTAGTYYAAFEDAINNCYSPTQIFTVTITSCCTISNVNISSNQTLCVGNNPNPLTTTTTPTGNGTLTYQWQQSTISCATGFSNINNANNVTYTPTNLTQTTYFRLIVTNTLGVNTCSDTSNCVTITYVNTPSVTVSAAATAVEQGTTTTLTAVVSNATLPIAYQWQSSSNQTNWYDIPNANNAIYTTDRMTSLNHYRVLISQSGTNCPAVVSAVIPIQIAVGSVGNYVWTDTNNNGINDEPANQGLIGVKVELWSVALNRKIDSTYTTDDANGNPGYYNFTIYISGDYYIKFPNTHGSKTLTTQTITPATDNNSDANPTTGQSPIFTINVMGVGVAKDNPTIDAGFRCALVANATISGGNLSCSVSQVTLTAIPTNALYMWNNGNTNITQTVTTEGVYTVTVTDAANGCTATASVTVNRTPMATVGNYVWADANGDGYNNETADAGINGLTIELWNNNTNTLVATTVTATLNGNPGYYQFCVSTTGTYYVKFPITNNIGKRLTIQNSDPATDNNSDADYNTGRSPVFTLDVNGTGIFKNNMTIDAGYQIPCPPNNCLPMTIIKTN